MKQDNLSKKALQTVSCKDMSKEMYLVSDFVTKIKIHCLVHTLSFVSII